MSRPSNVVHFPDRFSGPKVQSEELRPNELPSDVTDITELRARAIERERRKVKRTILEGFLGAFVVVPGRGLQKALVHDVSESGVAFDLGSEHGCFSRGEEVALRIYLNHATYFPFVIRIANVRELPDEGTFRHGGFFEEESVNREAMFHLAKFIEIISVETKSDRGDLQVSGTAR